MLWHGRPIGCVLWLPEDKKPNMWHVRVKCYVHLAAFPRSPGKNEDKLSILNPHF